MLKVDHGRETGIQKGILQAVVKGEIGIASHTPQEALARLAERMRARILVCSRQIKPTYEIESEEDFLNPMRSLRRALLSGNAEVGALILKGDIATGSRVIASLKNTPDLPGKYHRTVLTTLISRQVAQDMHDLGVLKRAQ
ncbi:MAG: hypothetical protein M1142_01890 [Patescibacteria group bacterium]|nr:hypothetical protein [Patescibacteria group bacterium]